MGPGGKLASLQQHFDQGEPGGPKEELHNETFVLRLSLRL